MVVYLWTACSAVWGMVDGEMWTWRVLREELLRGCGLIGVYVYVYVERRTERVEGALVGLASLHVGVLLYHSKSSRVQQGVHQFSLERYHPVQQRVYRHLSSDRNIGINIMAEVPAPTPITEWPDYSVSPTGGDVMTQNLNALYDKGDLCWMLVATILCWYADSVLSPRRESECSPHPGKSHQPSASSTRECIAAKPP